MANVNEFIVLSDYRENQEGLDELALSIQSDGLYQPILVKPYEGDDPDKKYEIVAGRRRFKAMTEYLHWKTLKKNEHFFVKEGIDALIAQFQENFNRQDFTPIEIARLVRNIHARQTEIYGHALKGKSGGWGLKDTGKLIGRDSAFVSRMITIAENENDVQNCETISAALEAVDKKKTKNFQSKVRKARYEKSKETIQTDADKLIENVKCQKAEDFLGELAPNSVDLVLTDPPYAINYDEMVMTDKYESYDDDPEEIKDILSSCIPEYFRVLREDRYCIIFTAFEWQQFVRNKMLEAGFKLATTPVLWIKLNSTGKSMNPARNLGSQAEVAIYGWKGQPELNLKGKGNVFPVEIVRKDRIHVAQKPDELLTQLVKIFTHKGQTVLDTFCGSLSTLRACYSSERNFLGCEFNEDFLMEAVNYTREWAKEQTDD